MINVEGNYEEIIKYLDGLNRPGIQHAGSHGGDYNVGLFSVVEDARWCSHLPEEQHVNCIRGGEHITIEEWDTQTRVMLYEREIFRS